MSYVPTRTLMRTIPVAVTSGIICLGLGWWGWAACFAVVTVLLGLTSGRPAFRVNAWEGVGSVLAWSVLTSAWLAFVGAIVAVVLGKATGDLVILTAIGFWILTAVFKFAAARVG